MSFIESVKSFFTNEEQPRGIVDDDQRFFSYVHKMWQYEQALGTVAKIVSTSLGSSEWKVYSHDERANKIYMRLNVAFNDNENAYECWGKVAHNLVFDGKCLIVEMNGKYYVADSFSLVGEKEKFMTPNLFKDVSLQGTILNKVFTQNKNAIYIKLPYSEEREELEKAISGTYDDALKLARKGAGKALGMKLNLELNAQNQNSYTKENLKNISTSYKRALDDDNAVVITYSGEKLYDLTEKQRGSEVQQVTSFTDNLKKVEENILNNVARAFGFPVSFLRGEFTEDSADLYAMAITFGVKPFTETLSKALTLFLFEEDSIVHGGKVSADVSKIHFVEAVSKANAIDKLISCGVYTINEVRQKLGDDTIEGGDKRYITKNYAEYGELQ